MKLIRTISALLLALLVLVSSTSFMVGLHFCMGEVQNISLFSKAEPCPMQQAMPPCHKHMKGSCCEDAVVIHEAKDFKASLAHLHIDAPAAIDLDIPLMLVSEVIPSNTNTNVDYDDYDPPLRSIDLTVAHRVLLI